MLDKAQVQHMADLFFGGNPEGAYLLFRDSNEWLQFQNSIKPQDAQVAYHIMANSNMEQWHKNHRCVPRIDYPTYEIEYNITT